MALKIVNFYLKNHNTICREEKNDAKHRYKINISILSKGPTLDKELSELISELHSVLDLGSSRCFINFTIADHPYDK
jgi:hypothetical protein